MHIEKNIDARCLAGITGEAKTDFVVRLEANNIFHIEKLLSGYDEIDSQIIRSLMQNMTYGDISETLFIS